MINNSLFKKAVPDILAVLVFLILSTAYFFTPMSEGLVLGGHDSVAAVGLGQEQKNIARAMAARLPDGLTLSSAVCLRIRRRLHIAPPIRCRLLPTSTR